MFNCRNFQVMNILHRKRNHRNVCLLNDFLSEGIIGIDNSGSAELAVKQTQFRLEILFLRTMEIQMINSKISEYRLREMRAIDSSESQGMR